MNYKDVAAQTESTYLDYKKIKSIFTEIGYFLEDYVVYGGETTKNLIFTNRVDVSDIIVSLDREVIKREGTTFETETPNSVYYLDFYKGDFVWGKKHPTENYITLAEIKTNENGLVDEIIDKREHVGGVRFGNPVFGNGSQMATGADVDNVSKDLMERAVNVKSSPYNIKGDGTVETQAIQSVFDLANQNGSVIIYFPDGDYVIDYYIRLYKNTTVIMSPNARIRRSDDTNYLKMFINGIRGRADYAQGYNGEGNIHFVGGIIDGNSYVNPNSAAVSMFDLGHGENITFKDMTFQNGENSHYFQVAGCKNVVFDNCIFKNDKYSATTGKADFECIQIEVLTESSFPSIGEWDNTPSRNITIQNCLFENVVRAIGTHGYAADPNDSSKVGVYCEDIKIINNVFRQVKDHVLSLIGYDGVIVKDNFIDGSENGYGIKVDHCKNVYSSGNDIRNTYNSGLSLYMVEDSIFKDDYLRDVAAHMENNYSSIRAEKISNTTVDEVVKGSDHYYPLFITDVNSNNRINWSRMDSGRSTFNQGQIGGSLESDQIGTKHVTLFEGDLNQAAQTVDLGISIRAFSELIVLGNNNGSATNNIVSLVIPNSAYFVGSPTDRFKLLTDNSDSLTFSFPNESSIRLDTLNGSCRIRRVIGKI